MLLPPFTYHQILLKYELILVEDWIEMKLIHIQVKFKNMYAEDIFF